jgi:hypothetical protein
MKPRFRLFRRDGHTFYAFDNVTGRQESLRTKDKTEAARLLHAMNEAHQQPAFSLQMARAYLMASDPAVSKRTWQDVLNVILESRDGETKARWERAALDKRFDLIRDRIIIETQAEQLWLEWRVGVGPESGKA